MANHRDPGSRTQRGSHRDPVHAGSYAGGHAGSLASPRTSKPEVFLAAGLRSTRMNMDRRDFVSFCASIFATSLMPRDLIAQITPMATRTIPVSGERLPVIGLGTYQAFDIA